MSLLCVKRESGPESSTLMEECSCLFLLLQVFFWLSFYLLQNHSSLCNIPVIGLRLHYVNMYLQSVWGHVIGPFLCLYIKSSSTLGVIKLYLWGKIYIYIYIYMYMYNIYIYIHSLLLINVNTIRVLENECMK